MARPLDTTAYTPILDTFENPVYVCLARAEATRDSVTSLHESVVGALTIVLCRALGYDEARALFVGQAASLHDIGKFALPSDLLHKPGRFDPEEWAMVQRHPRIGHGVLKIESDRFLSLAAEIALAHHERYDGTGYPEGRRGEAIPVEARIVAVVDVYEAMRASRPYKAGLGHDAACAAILQGDARSTPDQFDPAVLKAFARIESEIARTYKLEIEKRPAAL